MLEAVRNRLAGFRGLQGEKEIWGSSRKACRICTQDGGRERKARCDRISQSVCGEQAVRGACLESLLASGTRTAMLTMACKQGGHPFVTMSSCFGKYAVGAQVSPAYWHKRPRAWPWLT